ncbi:MAG: DUF342 domain-containing protein [candidate division Zixibacteria bacterium]|nr:DUF342 domain-containing protein [candidate division Zixibacteria bacterium]
MVRVTDDMKLAKVDEAFKISVSHDELQAYVRIDSEKFEGEELTPEVIIANLKAAGVDFGLKEDEIQRIASETLFNERVLVAEGLPPQIGKSAEFEFCFDPERKVAPKEGSDGRIDYRDMDFLQNAEPGQVLVKKIPPTEGTPGKSVKNEEIPAKSGKDKKLPKGANTDISPDGLTLSAEKAGTIVYAGGIVSIQPVTAISGSVDLSTGNITCRGSLKVGKDIKSDFKVDVNGNLEVSGNVEDAEIKCKGNVIVKGGFIGRGDGCINAEGDVTLKYIINQTINSRGNVTIGGEAVNAKIHARDRIEMIGSKAKVVGGCMTARRLIKGMTLGADAGTSTVLKVAYDTKLMEQYRNVHSEIERLKEDEKRVKAALVDLYRLHMNNKLPPQKQAVMKKLEEFKESLPVQFEELGLQKKELDKKMAEFKNAKVIAEKDVFPGVQVHIGKQYKESDTVRGPMIFELYSDSIVASSYDKQSYEAKEKARKKKEQKARDALAAAENR